MSGGLHRFVDIRSRTSRRVSPLLPSPQAVEGFVRCHTRTSARQLLSRRCWRHRRYILSHPRCESTHNHVSLPFSDVVFLQALKAAGAERSGAESRVVLSDINSSMFAPCPARPTPLSPTLLTPCPQGLRAAAAARRLSATQQVHRTHPPPLTARSCSPSHPPLPPPPPPTSYTVRALPPTLTPPRKQWRVSRVCGSIRRGAALRRLLF